MALMYRVKVFKEILSVARHSEKFKDIPEEEWNSYHFEIVSYNSFPTASGVASSASGLACLAAALNALFGNPLPGV